jgi:dipeptidyl aminopeptidase/acylaminoacyl peptidase
MDPELLFFPDEGHGFAKLENRLLFARRMVKFLNETIAK